jgi:hypothetical protein
LGPSAEFFASGAGGLDLAISIWPQRRNHSAAAAFQIPACCGCPPDFQGIQMKRTKVKRAVLPAGWPLPFIFAMFALALALLSMPHAGHAQGIVRGAREGSYEGNRVAGPVGGVVGGAIGAGVGGAMGAVEGVFGLPEPRWHRYCHGYRDGYGRFHCYRYY